MISHEHKIVDTIISNLFMVSQVERNNDQSRVSVTVHWHNVNRQVRTPSAAKPKTSQTLARGVSISELGIYVMSVYGHTRDWSLFRSAISNLQVTNGRAEQWSVSSPLVPSTTFPFGPLVSIGPVPFGSCISAQPDWAHPVGFPLILPVALPSQCESSSMLELKQCSWLTYLFFH